MRSSQPEPPLSARPATPVLETRPPTVASPWAWVAASSSAHVAPAPTLHDAPLGVDRDLAQAADVDDDAVVDERQPGHRVAARAHGDGEVAEARVLERGGDVLGPGAADDVARATLDAGVEERAGLFVLGLAGVVDVAAQAMAELVKGGVLDHLHTF